MIFVVCVAYLRISYSDAFKKEHELYRRMYFVLTFVAADFKITILLHYMFLPFERKLARTLRGNKSFTT